MERFGKTVARANEGQTCRTILVVDDEQDLGGLMTFLLQGEGYETLYAPNGEVALQRLAQSQPSLVVTDYMMPVMDGYELVKTMRRSKWLAATPVLIVSALPEYIVRDRCLVDAFLRKPFKAANFLNVVRSLLCDSE